LSKFAESKHTNLVDFSVEDWDNHYGFKGQALTFIESQLRDGKLLFLLDALDEAAIGRQKDERYATYKRVFEAIEQLSRSYPQLPIVVTARIAGYRQLAPLPFPEYEVLPFRPAEIRLFIEKWFGQPDPQAGTPDPRQVALGQELNDKLHNTIRIQTLVTNPLLLSLTTILYQKHHDLPTRRVDLYKRCSKLLLEGWDKTRLILRPSILDTDQKEQLRRTDCLIDHIVYQLYGLTEDEIAIVEGNVQ